MVSEQITPSHYASVVLPLPINTPFTYFIPPEYVESAEVGRRALVPFGKRMLTGFIVDVSDNPGNIARSKIKPIQNVLDDEPVFDDHMLKLSEWVADYYMTSQGEVLKASMPFGTMVKSRTRIYLSEGEFDSISSLTNQQKEVLDIIKAHEPVLLRTLERSYEKKNVLNIVRSLEKKGIVRIEREIDSPSVKLKTERYVKLVDTISYDVSIRAIKQKKCIEILQKNPEGIQLSELLERYSLSRGVVNAVVKAGYAEYSEVAVERKSKLLDQKSVKVDHPLTDGQKESFRLIMDTCGSPNPKPVLLQGVTGSGKTRVYIELVKEILKEGKGAIILVPEISLTPQTTQFFNTVFPGRVAVMHSAMSPGERYDVWHLIHDGTYDVVIGPRSAIFAPVHSPGIIIIDEEHDTSYKQNDVSPRYNAL